MVIHFFNKRSIQCSILLLSNHIQMKMFYKHMCSCTKNPTNHTFIQYVTLKMKQTNKQNQIHFKLSFGGGQKQPFLICQSALKHASVAEHGNGQHQVSSRAVKVAKYCQTVNFSYQLFSCHHLYFGFPCCLLYPCYCLFPPLSQLH